MALLWLIFVELLGLLVRPGLGQGVQSLRSACTPQFTYELRCQFEIRGLYVWPRINSRIERVVFDRLPSSFLSLKNLPSVNRLILHENSMGNPCHHLKQNTRQMTVEVEGQMFDCPALNPIASTVTTTTTAPRTSTLTTATVPRTSTVTTTTTAPRTATVTTTAPKTSTRTTTSILMLTAQTTEEASSSKEINFVTRSTTTTTTKNVVSVKVVYILTGLLCTALAVSCILYFHLSRQKRKMAERLSAAISPNTTLSPNTTVYSFDETNPPTPPPTPSTQPDEPAILPVDVSVDHELQPIAHRTRSRTNQATTVV